MKKPFASFDNFMSLDIRVGEVKSAEPLTGSQKLLKLMVDLGDDYGIVQILSGIAQWYKPEKIIGKKFAFVANLEPRKIMGEISSGMVMAADFRNKAVLLPLPKKLASGTILR